MMLIPQSATTKFFHHCIKTAEQCRSRCQAEYNNNDVNWVKKTKTDHIIKTVDIITSQYTSAISFSSTHQGCCRKSTWGPASHTLGRQRKPLWEESTGTALHFLLCSLPLRPFLRHHWAGPCHKWTKIAFLVSRGKAWAFVIYLIQSDVIALQ